MACSHVAGAWQEIRSATVLRGMHMPCVADKGSVASVTRSRRPRAGSSHGMSLINARSSFPLSEPSLKELHTSRAPLGLNKDMPTGCEAVLMKLCHWDLHKQFSPNDILLPDVQMQTDLKHMNTCEFKLSELTGNCFPYNNLAARSSACWCKYWQITNRSWVYRLEWHD